MSNQKKKRHSLKLFALIAFGAALLPLMLFGWKELYNRHLERVPPRIEVLELPRGVGIAPVRARFQISDLNSGLKTLRINVRDGEGEKKELLSRDLEGSLAEDVSVEFGGVASGVQEGVLALEVEVSDKSIWKTATKKSFPLRVDFLRPKVELLGSWPVIKEGSSGLIFYKAYDEEIGAAGVRVGSVIFTGFPAKYIDSDLEDKNLYVAIFAVPLGEAIRDLPVRVFVEDTVGNTASLSYPEKVLSRETSKNSWDMPEEFLRERLVAMNAQGADIKERFREVLKKNIPSEQELKSSLLATSRFERYWNDRFFNPQGAILNNFGGSISYVYKGEELDSRISQSNDYDMRKSDREVRSINNGVISIVDTVGSYGRLVAVDHGLGVFSVYSNLREMSKERGERIEGGEILGFAGETGLKPDGTLSLEIRIQGVSADPSEWLSASWYAREITKRITDVRKIYKLPIKASF